jgi:putative lipoic acid-binding regulatory protein
LTEGQTETEEDRRRRAIELLEANHAFPCEFSVSVISRNDPAVTAAVLAAARLGPDVPDGAHEQKPSQGAKYVSHRLKIPCPTADEVLQLFARLRAVDGVITVL